MVQTVLVTGASGYIALELVAQLLEAGQYKVRGTVRSVKNEKRCKPLRELVPNAKYPLELVEADLTDADGWEAAVKGVDYVLHTASPFFMAGGQAGEEQLVKPAVAGTLNVLRACAAPDSKVKRVVLTSSCAAVSDGHSDKPPSYVFTEKDWTNLDNVDGYVKSKTMAEKAAWDFVETNKGHRFELNVINPSMVVGPARGTPSTSVDLVKQMLNGELPMVPPIQMGVVDVRDVAAAHIFAMTSTKTGERFIVSATDMWFLEIAKAMAKEFRPQGYKVNTAKMPWLLAAMLAPFNTQVQAMLRFWGRGKTQDGSKSSATFGFKYRDIHTSLRETGEGLIAAEMVTPKLQGGSSLAKIVLPVCAAAAAAVAFRMSTSSK